VSVMERFGWSKYNSGGDFWSESCGWKAVTRSQPRSQRDSFGPIVYENPGDALRSGADPNDFLDEPTETSKLELSAAKALGLAGSQRQFDGANGEADSALSKRRRVEAILFLSRSPLPSRKLSQLAGLADATEARTLVRQLNQVYADCGRSFRAEEVGGGYQLMTRPALAPWLRRLGHIPKTLQLTPPAMETLSIVAYRQPVLRADIEAIRGVACGEILRQLMERDLVRISGRSEELGRPYLYSTTKSFLQNFGLRDVDALPALDRSDFTFSENPDWSDAGALSDPSLDQQPVNDVPEEESEVNTAIADLEIACPECDDEAPVGLFAGHAGLSAFDAPAAAIEDEEDEVFVDDDEEDDFEDDDDWDDDEDEVDEEEEVDAEVDPDADWEEVEDEDDDEEDEEDAEDDWDDEDDEDDDSDDDWDDEDDEDIEDDEDEWD
jgi:segregation and condensation protein B